MSETFIEGKPYKTRSNRETIVLACVQEALSYALMQVHEHTERKLVAQEFWHSQNRKGIVQNDEVEPLITMTIQSIKNLEKRSR